MALRMGTYHMSASAIPGVATNSAYVALDAFGSSFKIPELCGREGGVITDLQIFDLSTANASLRLHLFAASASGSVNGVPFAIAAVDRWHYLGHINVDTTQWVTAAATENMVDVTGINKGIWSPSGNRSVYGQWQIVSGRTNNVANPVLFGMTVIPD